MFLKRKKERKERLPMRRGDEFRQDLCFKSIEKPRLRKDVSVYFYVCCNIIMSGTEREVSLGATVERSLTKTLKIILNLVLLVL